MITNYKITDFVYRRNDKVLFRVYPLDQFIDIVEQNAKREEQLSVSEQQAKGNRRRAR